MRRLSEQNNELAKARQLHDTILISSEWQKKTFDDHPALTNIMTWVNSPTAVIVDGAKSIDNRIMDSIMNQLVTQASSSGVIKQHLQQSDQSRLDQSTFQLTYYLFTIFQQLLPQIYLAYRHPRYLGVPVWSWLNHVIALEWSQSAAPIEPDRNSGDTFGNPTGTENNSLQPHIHVSLIYVIHISSRYFMRQVTSSGSPKYVIGPPDHVLVNSNCFNYELCSQPASLFGDSPLLWDTPKSIRTGAIWLKNQAQTDLPNSEVQYVLNRGVFLYTICHDHRSRVLLAIVVCTTIWPGNSHLDGYGDYPQNM